MTQTVKETFLEIKEIAFGQHNIDIESYSYELSNRSLISFDDIKNLFNDFSMLYINEQNPELGYNGKKIWHKSEDRIINQYVELASNEIVETARGMKKKTKGLALEELNDILIGRTASSISFRYYEMNRTPKDKVEKVEKVNTTETIQANDKYNETNSDDLLDMVVDIVENVDEVGIDVNGLFKSLLVMSKKAVENNSDTAKIEEMEGKVAFLEGELDSEKSKNESLQVEVSKMIAEFEKLKSEIEYFDGLNGKQKLQQLNNFNRNMKYIVDKFGGVISVGNAV